MTRSDLVLVLGRWMEEKYLIVRHSHVPFRLKPAAEIDGRERWPSVDSSAIVKAEAAVRYFVHCA